MDFDRFTRSMLLAQGGFAAFLQADADQRAPILEQITGTEIYSHISVKVHELRGAETKQLDLLQAELAGMELLSEEDEKQLRENLAEQTKSNDVLTEQLKKTNLAISWLEGIAETETELTILNEQQQELTLRQHDFQPELDKLERAKQALELSADYAGLTAMRSEQQRSQQTLINSQQTLPELDKQNAQAATDLMTATASLEQIKNQQKHAQLEIRKVRELDLKIQVKQAPITTSQHAVVNNEQQLEKLQKQQDDDIQALQRNEAKLSELTALLTQHKTDEGLIEQLESIRNQFKSLVELATVQQQKKTELSDAEHKKLETTKAWQTQSSLLAVKQKEFEQIQLNLSHYQNALTQRLESRTLSAWRQDLVKLTERKTLLAQCTSSMQSLAGFRNDLNKLVELQTVMTTAELGLTQELNQKIEATHALEREVDLLNTQYLLQKKIESYEEARQHLHDDEPCPLCGAKEHPYAEGNIPVLDDTLTSLNKVKSDLKHSSESVSKLSVKIAENQKDQQQNSQQQQETHNKIQYEEHLLTGLYSSLAIEGDVTDRLLTQCQQDNEVKFKLVASIVTDAEKMEQQLAHEREVLDNKRAELAEVEQQLQLVSHANLMAELAFDRLVTELENATAQQMSTLASTLKNVSLYGIEELTTDNLDQTLQQLTARRDRWRAWQKDKGMSESLIASLSSQIKHQLQHITKLESELKVQHQTLNQLRSECDLLNLERKTIFADKDPDIEEKQLINAVEQAEQNLDSARALAQKSEQALNKLKHSIEALMQEIDSRNKQLDVMEAGFKQRLLSTGFSDEENYMHACLGDDVRKLLQEQDQQLKSEHHALVTRISDKTTQLAKEREKQITQQSLVELKDAFTKLSSALNDLQQQIGGIRQKLSDNEKIRLKQTLRVQQIEAQTRECARWNTLHELIGSADGKKYRNFAQGLTFEMMIGHANRQLQKMTDRYLLIRDEAQPLELNVVDNYQAGETRSTKNLSGGESFIVSLALALGLSQMASKNVRVDSLFLDEGFGTLDEEALDTALETLAGLQQEGKLIGVISHVQVLKERISTQIQISPSSGGRSIISGPGISRLSI